MCATVQQEVTASSAELGECADSCGRTAMLAGDELSGRGQACAGVGTISTTSLANLTRFSEPVDAHVPSIATEQLAAVAAMELELSVVCAAATEQLDWSDSRGAPSCWPVDVLGGSDISVG